MATLAEAESLLLHRWGFPRFRYSQRKVVLACLRGRDVLALLPTGGGKSICFQVPALAQNGTTIVVSPLISLMQDQVAALRRRNVAAAYISSTQSRETQSSLWESFLAGRLKILYVAPERMAQLVTRSARVRIPFLAVDEAHCISEWGHDFRPHYRSLGRHRIALGSPATIAVTATATPQTRDDIIRVLRLRRPVVVHSSFDRPNLIFSARRFHDERSRLQLTGRLLKKTSGSAIVYVPTRNRTDGVVSVLRWWNHQAYPYHAGLPSKDRRTLLERFLSGDIRFIVATNAFGMGIDKPDVQRVIHLGVPTRPEAYYQEAGRAGRDGSVAACDLFWRDSDFVLAKRMAGVTKASPWTRVGGLDLVKLKGLQTMERYARTRGCRRRVLMRYLGEELGACAGCDRCRPDLIGGA